MIPYKQYQPNNISYQFLYTEKAYYITKEYLQHKQSTLILVYLKK